MPANLRFDRGVASSILILVIGMQTFIIQPGFVAELINHVGISEVAAGWVVAAEMAGIATATIIAALLGNRFSRKANAAAAIAIAVAANLLSTVVSGIVAMAAARGLAGFGCGFLISIGYESLAAARNPAKALGLGVTTLLLYGAIGVLALPILSGVGGFAVIGGLLALMALLGWAVLPQLPERKLQPETTLLQSATTPRGTIINNFAMVTAFFLGQGVIWPYLSVMGEHAGVMPAAVASALALSQIGGMAGALGATLLRSRRAILMGTLIGSLGCAIPVFCLAEPVTAISFGYLVFTFNTASNLVTPLIIALTAVEENGEQLVQKLAAFQMLALAIGPAVSASVIQHTSMADAFLVAGTLFALVIGIIVQERFAFRRKNMTASKTP